MWIIEVDADASNVRFVAGDYEQEILGRLMSTSPFFKAVQVFRYSKRNLRVPALISCASKQQAYDLWTYLKKHKPRGRPRPGLILGDTSEKERKSLLSDFECGHIDTLIQVNVLIEGWNAPRCKLLLDLAPSLSRVRATQKYFRVMTRYKDKEARIVVILPKHLARQPVLPVDLILKPGEKYLCGDLLKPADKHTPTTGNSIEKTFQTPVKSVKVKTHVIACASLAKPDLDPDNLDQIRQVLASCPDFSLSLPFGRIGFKRLFFNHPLFVGTGDTLLRFIGIPDEQNAYLTLMFKLFPENMGNLITKRNGFFEDEQWRNCENDFKYIKHAALEPNDNGGKPRGPFISTLNALCGGIKEVATPEEAILIREQVGHVVKLMEELDDRQRQILIHRLGLFGKPDLTWNEIGLKLGVSRERIRQIFFKALRKLRKKYLYRVRDDNPITKAVFEYPDLFEIISKK
jgi:RNA polymerase sigma factor (sigma-70 family)